MSGLFNFIPQNGEENLYLLRDGPDASTQTEVRENWGSTNVGGEREINVHQVSQVSKIWDSKGYESLGKVSIWRVDGIQGYFGTGDIVVEGYESPGVGFLLKGLLTIFFQIFILQLSL